MTDFYKPLSPDYYVDALNESIHKDIGRSRIPKVVRVKKGVICIYPQPEYLLPNP